jgi:hypothetical protein
MRLTASIIGLTAALGVTVFSATAQETNRNFLVDLVPILPGLTNAVTSSIPFCDTTRAESQSPDRQLSTPGSHAAHQRWEKFVNEYHPGEATGSHMRDSLVSAKYGLDRMVFTVQEFTLNLEDALRFEYDMRHLGGRASSPGHTRPFRFMEDAKLRSDLKLNVSQGAYVGLRFSMPVGN